MKKRIISMILVIVMAVMALVGCAESLVDRDLNDNIEAEFDVNAFFKKLGELKIEDGTYSADPIVRALVESQKIYGDVSAAIVKAGDKLGEGSFDENDVLYYCYYVTYEKDGKSYVYEYAQMKETNVTDSNSGAKVPHNIYLGSVSSEDNTEDDFLEALKAAIDFENIGDIKDYIYSTNSASKVVTVGDDDEVKVAISYTKTWTETTPVAGGEDETVTKTEKALYEVVTLSKAMAENNALVKFLIGDGKDVVALKEGVNYDSVTVKVGSDVAFTTYKMVTGTDGTETKDKTTANEFTLVEDGKEYTYSEVGIEWIIESEGKEIATITDKTYKESTKLENNAAHEHIANEENPDLKDVELTYHIYPVYYYDVPEIDATALLKDLLGSSLKADSFEALESEDYKSGEGESAKTVKALVAELIDIYAKDSSKTETFDKNSADALIKKLYAIKSDVYENNSADADLQKLYYLFALKNVEKAVPTLEKLTAGETPSGDEVDAFNAALTWIAANMAEDEAAEEFFVKQKAYEDNKKIIEDATSDSSADTPTSDQKSKFTLARTNYAKEALNLFSNVKAEIYDETLEEAVDGKIAAIVGAKNADGKTAGEAIFTEKLDAVKHTLDDEYRTYIVKEIGKEIYSIIDESVKIVSWAGLEDLVEEYYDHLYESYEYKFYKENYNTSNSYYSWYNADFEAFLVSEHGTNAKATHGGDWEKAITDEAKEFLTPMVKLYVVAKALESDAAAVLSGFVDADIASGAYEADYEWDDKLSDKENKKAEKEAKENAEKNKEMFRLKNDGSKFIVTDEVFKEYRKEYYGSSYDYYEQMYGEDNIRAGLQFDKLFYYLTAVAFEEVEHDGEEEFVPAYDASFKDENGNFTKYVIKFQNTKLGYDFKADDADSSTDGDSATN